MVRGSVRAVMGLAVAALLFAGSRDAQANLPKGPALMVQNLEALQGALTGIALSSNGRVAENAARIKANAIVLMAESPELLGLQVPPDKLGEFQEYAKKLRAAADVLEKAATGIEPRWGVITEAYSDVVSACTSCHLTVRDAPDYPHVPRAGRVRPR